MRGANVKDVRRAREAPLVRRRARTHLPCTARCRGGGIRSMRACTCRASSTQTKVRSIISSSWGPRAASHCSSVWGARSVPWWQRSRCGSREPRARRRDGAWPLLFPHAGPTGLGDPVALLVATIIAVTIVLPAERGVDPTGVGTRLGLTAMGRLKRAAGEAADKPARAVGTSSAKGYAPSPATIAATLCTGGPPR